MSDDGQNDQPPPDDGQDGPQEGRSGEPENGQQKDGDDPRLHLRLRAGRNATINIGIDGPPPEGDGGGEDKGKKGEDDKKGGEDDKNKDGDKKEEEKPSPLKKTWVRVVLALVILATLIVLLIWLFHWWTFGRFQQETNDAYLKVDQITVSPQTSGYVTQVLVDDNQMVAAGQVLVKIDPLPYQAKLQQALAQVDVAKADIVRDNAEIARQQAQVAQTQAQLDGAKANTVFYGNEVIRYLPLSAAGAETSEKLAQLQNSHKQPMARCAATTCAASAACSAIACL